MLSIDAQGEDAATCTVLRWNVLCHASLMVWKFGKRIRAFSVGTREVAAYRAAVRAGDDVAAERLARARLERDPSDHALWFDVALAAKRRRDWVQAVELNERALEAMVEIREGEPAAWNLGIAATALGAWDAARVAWRQFGLVVPDGDGPVIFDDLGLVPVRLNPTGSQLGEEPLEIEGQVFSPEVVWAERLSPAHARVISVPSPGSGHRWGDVVLNDGVPSGERHDGREWVPVFDELALLERSEHRTWAVPVRAPGPADGEELTSAADAAGLAAEDWSGNIRILCAACSAGRPDHHHTHTVADASWSADREVGVAAPDEATVRSLLDAWVAAGSGRAYGEIERVV